MFLSNKSCFIVVLVGGGFVGLGACASDDDGSGAGACVSDAECKAGRVCIAGVCEFANGGAGESGSAGSVASDGSVSMGGASGEGGGGGEAGEGAFGGAGGIPPGSGGSGGFVETGGFVGAGGFIGTGGVIGAGGVIGTGGAGGTGGFVSRGGAGGTGGVVGRGGAGGTGGVVGTGGSGGSVSYPANPCINFPFATGYGYACGANIEGDPARLYLCNGQTTFGSVLCPAGCHVGALGEPDYCIGSDPCINNPYNGVACGSNLATPYANQNYLYNCSGQQTVGSVLCLYGCYAAPPGQDDYCMSGG